MILGELPALKKLLPGKAVPAAQPLVYKIIALSKLEVVQLFHVSPTKNRASILTYGLLPKARPAGNIISYPPRVFVSSTYQDAAFDYVAPFGIDVWTFYLPKEFLFPDECANLPNHYYIECSVPWYKLILLETRC